MSGKLIVLSLSFLIGSAIPARSQFDFKEVRIDFMEVQKLPAAPVMNHGLHIEPAIKAYKPSGESSGLRETNGRIHDYGDGTGGTGGQGSGRENQRGQPGQSTKPKEKSAAKQAAEKVSEAVKIANLGRCTNTPSCVLAVGKLVVGSSTANPHDETGVSMNAIKEECKGKLEYDGSEEEFWDSVGKCVSQLKKEASGQPHGDPPQHQPKPQNRGRWSPRW